MAFRFRSGNDSAWVTLSSPLDIRTPSLGKAARFLRQSAELSQDEVARASDLHVTHISELERGHGNPNHQTLHRLAKGLGVPPSYLLMLKDVFERKRKRKAQSD